MITNTPCVIFAGGRSSRMQEDKALLPFGEFKTLTEFQLNKLSKIFSNVYISCKTKQKFDFQANFIEDVKTQNVYAPTAGFVAVFETLQCESFFALSVDAPFVNESIIKRLIDADNPILDATVAKTPFGIQPMCGIYHQSLKSSFLQMLEQDNHKLGFLLKNTQTKIIEFQDDTPFLNLNKPQDYQQALNALH